MTSFTLCNCILCVKGATSFESEQFIRLSDNKSGEKCVERTKCNLQQIRFKKQQKISVKGQNLDFSEAMAAILENGGHIFTLNPLFSTSCFVSSSSYSNFTYLVWRLNQFTYCKGRISFMIWRPS